MTDPGTDVSGLASIPAHEIRRFESVIWSLYMLSDNPSVPPHCRAACRVAADHATAHMKPSDRAVPSLVNLVIEVGGAQTPPSKDAVLKPLRQIGWEGSPEVLDTAPAPLDGPPTRTLVSDKMRKQALDNILAECERLLKDTDLLAPQRTEYTKRLEEIRAMNGDVRTQTDRAWALLEVLERNLYARTRETGVGG